MKRITSEELTQAAMCVNMFAVNGSMDSETVDIFMRLLDFYRLNIDDGE